MVSIKDLRKKLGLTQAQLAFFLGIPWNTFSLAEKGLRFLRTEDYSRLDELEISMAAPGPPESSPPAPLKESREITLARANICRLDISMAERRLRLMMTKFIGIGESLQRVQKIINNPNADISKTWYWKEQQEKLALQQAKYGPLKQAILEEQIKILEAKAVHFENRASQVPGTTH